MGADKMEKLVMSIVDKLVLDDVIEDSQRSIYEMGFHQLFTILFNTICTIVIGMFFKCVDVALLLCILFMMMQRYAGSYHASTRVKCYIVSMTMIGMTLFIFQQVNISWQVQLIMVILLSLFIILLSPVENRNKKLDDLEKKVYHKRCIITCVVYMILWCVFTIANVDKYAQIIVFALLDIVILQTAGKIDLHMQHEDDLMK